VPERSNVSDAATSDDSGGKAVAAAAADAFDLLSAVKQVHSRFNNSAKRPYEIDRYAARLSTAACEVCVGGGGRFTHKQDKSYRKITKFNVVSVF